MQTQTIELKNPPVEVEAVPADAEVEAETTSAVPEDGDGQDGPCADQPLTARIEALLISTDRPLTEARLAELLDRSGRGVQKTLREAIESLNAEYERGGRAFRVERLAGGWQILTVQAFGPLLARLHAERQASKLSQAALETLAIIAYRQPVMRAEIEAIRGVASGEVLRGLMERRLVKIVGRAEELGRPMLYGTTGQFLKVFGLSSPDDLPAVEGLTREASYTPRKPEPEPEAVAETPAPAEEAPTPADEPVAGTPAPEPED